MVAVELEVRTPMSEFVRSTVVMLQVESTGAKSTSTAPDAKTMICAFPTASAGRTDNQNIYRQERIDPSPNGESLHPIAESISATECLLCRRFIQKCWMNAFPIASERAKRASNAMKFPTAEIIQLEDQADERDVRRERVCWKGRNKIDHGPP